MSNNTFTRDDTAVLKGVAILMMLWLHLFHDAAWYSLSTTLVSVLGKPLVAWVSNATNPVYFFTFLSGYGLYLSYKKGKSDNFLRVKKLYFHYWFYTIFFVLIGFLLAKPGYPGGWLLFCLMLQVGRPLITEQYGSCFHTAYWHCLQKDCFSLRKNVSTMVY